MSTERKRVVVIGAGFGGLSAAAYLARSGNDVTVLEKNRSNSAQTQVLKKKGFTFDLNPSRYLMPDVFDDFFRDFGTTAHEQYSLDSLQPSYKIFTHETAYEVTSWPDIAELFDALEPGSSKHLSKLLHRGEREYNRWREQLNHGVLVPKVPQIFKPSERKPYHQATSKAFKNQDLQHIVEMPLAQMSANPQATPAIYQYLSYAALAIGAAHPHGGFASVATAIQKVAKQAGATIRFNAPVTKIITEKGRITGVQVGDDIIPCDVVVSNADMHWVETELLEPKDRSHHEHFWEKRELTPSSVVACLGIKKSMPELNFNNVLLDMDWPLWLKQTFTDKEWSPKPLVFIGNPSKRNPRLAPKGHENIVLHIPVVAGLNPSDEQLERLLLSVIGRLQEQLGYEFMNDIVVADTKGQDHFEAAFHAYKGNMNGLSPTLSQLINYRPNAQSRKVPGLFYIGGYSTPGNMPALAIANGKVIANRISQ